MKPIKLNQIKSNQIELNKIELNFHETGRRLYYFPIIVVFEVNLTGLP